MGIKHTSNVDMPSAPGIDPWRIFLDQENISMQITPNRKRISKDVGLNALAVFRKLSQSVASVFIKLRKKKGYSSYENFAFAHDFPRAQYWRVENGRGNLTLLTLAKLLAIHELTLDAFLQQVIEEYTTNEKTTLTGERRIKVLTDDVDI
jgi:hypothetical protein